MRMSRRRRRRKRRVRTEVRKDHVEESSQRVF